MKESEHKVMDVVEIEFPAILHKIKSIKKGSVILINKNFNEN